MRTPLSSLLSRVLPQSQTHQQAERSYREQVISVARRVRAVFEAWADMRQMEPDYALLANGAAVQRWELMRLAHEVEAYTPPRGLGGVQRELLERAVDAARACQLLANGYRSHKSEAICDGQALFVDTVASLERLAKQMDLAQ
jgi:hypothetical protein